jgi:hypothetical protein
LVFTGKEPLLGSVRLLRLGQPLGKAFQCVGHIKAVDQDRLRLGVASDAIVLGVDQEGDLPLDVPQGAGQHVDGESPGHAGVLSG